MRWLWRSYPALFVMYPVLALAAARPGYYRSDDAFALCLVGVVTVLAGYGASYVALREWTAKFLGIPVGEVAKHVIFVLSGGCPGVITPHIAAVTREWVEVPDESHNGQKRLVVGRAGSAGGASG